SPTGRRLRMGKVLGKIVRNRSPGHFRLRPDVHLRLRHAFIVDHAEWDSPVLRQMCWFVPERRAARAAEHPEAIARVVLTDTDARVADDQVSRLDQAPRRVCSPGEFTAMSAMAVSTPVYGARDLVC